MPEMWAEDGIEPETFEIAEDDGDPDLLGMFAEDPPGPEDTALSGRDGERAGKLLSISVDAGRDVLHRLTAQAVARLLDDPEWGHQHVLFDDSELAELADSLASARVAGDLLGRTRIRRLAEHAPPPPQEPVKFAEGYRAFECPRCGCVAYDGDPARNIRYRNIAKCTQCGLMPPAKDLKPLFAAPVDTFADPPDTDPFDVFSSDPPVLTPKAAAEYFKGLVPTIGVKPERYAPLFHRHAFTMANFTDELLLSKVKAILQDVIENGGTREEARDRIQDILDNLGVTPTNPQYADMVYRTNAMDAYAQGQQSEYADPEIKAAFPAWEYHAIRDSRSRPHHAVRDGNLYPPDITFTQVRGTDAANVCNCRCSWSPVNARELQKRLANGETIQEE